MRAAIIFDFLLSKVGAWVSGWKSRTDRMITAEMINVDQSTHLQPNFSLCPIRPPMAGPTSNPIKTEFLPAISNKGSAIGASIANPTRNKPVKAKRKRMLKMYD